MLGFSAPATRAEMPAAALPGAQSQSVPSLAPMLKDAMPAVVNLAARNKARTSDDSGDDSGTENPFQDPFFNNPLFKRFFHDFPFPNPDDGQQGPRSDLRPGRKSAPEEVQAIGSGVIVDAARGYILTNHHVIKNAEEVFVILQDKRKLDARVIGSDPDTDIAVLQVKSDKLKALPLGNSDALEVGDYVVAIGNPFGLGHTVTSGIVSALGRSGLGIEGFEDFIQTDASINPGNSGGALLNLKGELIGINTAIFSKTGGNLGIGFAIPINMAKNVMDQIVSGKKINRGHIGIQIQDVTPDIADALGLDHTSGALIAKIVEGSPAEKAGLKEGDIVTTLNGQDVKGSSHLKNLVGMLQMGSQAELGVMRSGKPLKVTVKIGKVDFAGSGGDQSAGDIELFKGARFSAIPSENHRYGKVEGVLVTAVEYGSPAWRAGLREDDIIVSVNQESVKTVDDLTKAAGKKTTGILLNIRRGDGALFIVIK